MDKQNNGFALVLAHTYTIICPTTVETEMSMWKKKIRIARGIYKCFATNQGNSDSDGFFVVGLYAIICLFSSGILMCRHSPTKVSCRRIPRPRLEIGIRVSDSYLDFGFRI